MGQLAHAHDQMMAWLGKTRALLDTLDTRPGGGLKQVEIELCKLRMVQNDIAAHQPSFEAIQVGSGGPLGEMFTPAPSPVINRSGRKFLSHGFFKIHNLL